MAESRHELIGRGGRRHYKKPDHHIKDQRTYDWIRRTFVGNAQVEKAIRAFKAGIDDQLNFLFDELLNLRAMRRGYVGDETVDSRRQVLFQAFKQLREDGIKLRYITELKGRHVTHLLQRWDREGLANGTIQTRITHLRFFVEVIGKPGLIQPKAKIAANGIAPTRVTRESVTNVDKSWSAKKVDIPTMLKQADLQDVRLGLILRAIAAFGLRVKEAVRLPPHEADQGSVIATLDVQALDVIHGTKGGRHRLVPIDTPELRALVDEMKRLVPPGDSLSGRHRKLDAALRWYYREIAKLGITKDQLGITSHGLRHEYVHDRLEMQGVIAPVKAMNVDEPTTAARPKMSRKEIMVVRRAVSESIGHSRPSMITAYSGSFVRPPQPSAAPDGVMGLPQTEGPPTAAAASSVAIGQRPPAAE
ncbi:MAG: integrase domain-containing protein [Rhodocyclaceae bacterium]|nr:integrase domain-containing protein [Rhodocyclaceae bacterium]